MSDLRQSNMLNQGAAVKQTTTQNTVVCEHPTTINTTELRNVEATAVQREFVKDTLITERTNETVREAPIVHEKHVYHTKPVLQEQHIIKEVPVVERTIIHEQPQLTTRQVIHEQPVLIKQQQVVQETLPTQHEVQHVQHELRTIQDTKFVQAPHVHEQQTVVQKDLKATTLQQPHIHKEIQQTQTTVKPVAAAGAHAPLQQGAAVPLQQNQLQGNQLLSHGLTSTLDSSRTGKPL